jgi:flavin-dependent dehydrogenase
LADLGLVSALREVTPPISRMRIQRSDGRLDLTLADDTLEYCPRRERFDALLQRAAVESGAQLRDQTRALGLVVEDQRVVGARLKDAAGREYVVRAQWVVGADGRASRVADWAGAEEYLGYEPERAIYWSYWTAPTGYGATVDAPGMLISNPDGMVRIAFHTDDEQVLVGCLPELCDVPRFRTSPLASLRDALAADPSLAELTAGAPREPMRGYLPQRYFFRRPVGAGWLLIGDAGVHKEFVTGDGMTEAMLQARSASEALAVGTERALQRWWHERDLRALPMYFFGKLQGAAGTPPKLDGMVMRRAATEAALHQRFVQMLCHECSPFEVVPRTRLFSWLCRELLRGRLGLVSEMIQRGRWLAQFERVLAERRALLATVAATPLEA